MVDIHKPYRVLVGQALGVKEEGGDAADREVVGERGVRAASGVGRGGDDAEGVKREEGGDGDGRKRARGDGEGDAKGEGGEEGLRRKQVKHEATEEGGVEKGEEGEGEGEGGKQSKEKGEKKEQTKQLEKEEEEKGVASGAGGSSAAGERAEEEGGPERPPLRLLVVGRKLLPTPSHRSRPHWGYVDAVSQNVADIRAALDGDTYETKTRGTQHVAAARAAAAGRYLIVSHVPGTRGSTGRGAARSSSSSSSSRKSHTHLVYSLRWSEAAGVEEKAGGQQGPEGREGEQASGKKVGEAKSAEQAGEKKGEQESPQEAFNIEREASYVLQVKNPQAPSRPPYLARPSVHLQTFPPPLQQRLHGLRFAPADPPGFLDHPGCELLLIAASDDLQREFGGEMQRDLAVRGGEKGEGGVEGGGGGGGL
ncbi:unnamed protein product [Closterium sp. Naga37s-1]|nr:unnamed protein product [Closterium sp. Naga37s-1]